MNNLIENLFWKLFLPPFLSIIIPLVVYDIIGHEINSIAIHITSWISIVAILYSTFLITRYKLLGTFGSTILLLLPTFIWLVPEYTNVLQGMIIFSAVLLFIFYYFSFIYYFFRLKQKLKNRQIIFLSNMLNLSFAVIAFASIFILSVVFNRMRGK